MLLIKSFFKVAICMNTSHTQLIASSKINIAVEMATNHTSFI